MPEQSYSNHRKYVAGYHFVLSLVVVLSTIGSIVNLVRSIGVEHRVYSAALLVTVHIALVLMVWYVRIFPLKAQDRAIRAEENLRHYVLTGKLLDHDLRFSQVAALRFASDEEFPVLAARAAAEKIGGESIKKAIENWRPDTDRV